MADSYGHERHHDDRPRDDAPITTAKDIESDRTLFAEAVTINRPAQELYAYWRDLPNLATFMHDVEAIEPLGENRYRWRARGLMGRTMEWDAVVTNEVSGRSLTWQSAEGSDVDFSGKVEFREAGARGTVVRSVASYDPPGGIIGKVVGKLTQHDPRIQTRRDLRRFKQLMETGEIATAARTHTMLEKEQAE